MLFAAAAVLGPSAVRADDAEDLARAVAEGWQNNRASFPALTGRYRRIVGRASNREQALKGELTASRSVHVLWIVDGERERCSVLVDAAGVRKVRDALGEALAEDHDTQDIGGPRDVRISGFIDETYLALGDVRMHSSSLIGGMTLYGPQFPADEGGNDIATPFSMGVMGPGATKTPAWLIDDWLEDGRGIDVRNTKGASGRELVSVRLNEDAGGHMLYAFDLDRGCLTERIVHQLGSAGSGNMELIITDMRECTGGRWFPMRSVRMDGPVDRPDEQRDVTILEVVDLETDKPPAAEAFAIKVPARSHVNERSDPRTQFYLTEPMTVTPEKLPELLDRAMLQLKRHQDYRAAKAPPQRRWLSIVSASILAAIAGLLIYRAIRSRRSATSWRA